MTLRMMICLGTASSALIAATPALAQQEMNYEERVYEYAQPAQQAAQAVIFTSEPVVQAAPVQQPVTWVEQAPQQVQRVRYVKDPVRYAAPVRTQQVEYEVDTVVVAQQAPRHSAPVATRTIYAAPVPHHAAPQQAAYAQPVYAQQAVYAQPVSPPQAYAQPAYAPPPQAYAQPAYAPGAQQAGFDREAWLDMCRDRIRGRESGSNGAVIGGLLGAITGGIVGNRSYGSERLAGTLIGGGIGGLAGLAIGGLIGGSGGRDNDRGECEDYLLRWEEQQSQRGYYGNQGYAQGYAQSYTMVPVTVAIPQRAIITEYVTTEYVTEYVTEEVQVAPIRRRVIRQVAPAPRQTTRVRYIKNR